MSQEEPLTLRSLFQILTDKDRTVVTHVAPVEAPVAPRQFQKYTPLSLGNRLGKGGWNNMADAILPPTHVRVGVLQNQGDGSNVSLASSMDVLLYGGSSSDKGQMTHSLERYLEFFRHSLAQNTAVDKIKNTARVKKANAGLVSDLVKGNYTDTLLQRVCELEEVNLLVFDLYRHQTTLYWAKGVTWPYFNPHRQMLVLVSLGECYEPVLCNCHNKERCRLNMTLSVLTSDKILGVKPELSLAGFLYLTSAIPTEKGDLYSKICERYGTIPPADALRHL